MVYRAGPNAKAIHLDPDCHGLVQSDQVRESPAEAWPEAWLSGRRCSRCWPD